MPFRLSTLLFRSVVFVGLPYALACGGNSIDFVDASDGNATLSIDGNAQSSNVVIIPSGGNGNTVSVGTGNPNNANSTMKQCPTPTTPVTYTNTTKALINDHCLSCHTARNPKMTTYATAKTAFSTNGGQFDVQNGVMPPSSSETLSFAIKCQFQAWEDNNFAQ